MKWSEHITKFNFLKTQKPLLINGSKWSGDRPLEKNLLDIFRNLKSGS